MNRFSRWGCAGMRSSRRNADMAQAIRRGLHGWTVMTGPLCAMQMTVSKEEAEAERQRRNKAGMDAVLAGLQAAKKANVLDKSRSDWTDFKRSDTQV